MSKKVFLKGTLILACTGLVSRIAGFFYRIFLSHAIGAEGLGLYQLILPLQGLMAALSYTGIQSADCVQTCSSGKKGGIFFSGYGNLCGCLFFCCNRFSAFSACRFFCFHNPESTRDLRSSSADGCQYTTLRHSLLH